MSKLPAIWWSPTTGGLYANRMGGKYLQLNSTWRRDLPDDAVLLVPECDYRDRVAIDFGESAFPDTDGMLSGRFVGDEFHPLTDLDGWQPSYPEGAVGD